MPPFVGRKRASASPIPAAPPRKKVKTQETPVATRPGRKVTAPKQEARISLSDSESSSLSDVDSDEFEDVASSSKPARTGQVAHDGHGDDEDDIDWEDAPAKPAAPDFSDRQFKDVKITVEKDDDPMDYTVRATSKKGPSRREKESRMLAHKMHVQFLLWHNAKRNAWLNDKEVHKILLRQLPSQITKEIEKWKRASGMTSKPTDASPSDKRKKSKKWKANGERNERDWGRPSQLLDEGRPDMSSGDPLISLLKILAAFWKKRFAITAPGLRKRGYGPKYALRKDIDSFKNDKHHPAKHGEKIENLEQFQKLAEICEGSRDLGAQLFTALLRAIGIESRMVASLQPVGYGFTKVEEMVPRKLVDPEEPVPENTKEPKSAKRKSASRKGLKNAPINLDSDNDSSSLSDSDSVVDVTPSMPKAKPPKYDRDLLFPVYWTEAASPITSKVYPVTPFLFENSVATSAELLMAFEPKGAKAEQTRQVMAYVVAYSSDCTAKDVTVRYLRKRQWPGKTKAFRVPVDKIPIYDKRGKVKRYEDYDWFKHVLGFYTRADKNRTAVDDAEDATDLVPAEPEKKQVEGDTLQSLKASSDFVIEKHLRREEALVPGAEPVRTFVMGKGEKQEEHLVYKRSDVRRAMTAESWHKEGRAPKEGEAPMKLAPVRAVTLARKREAEAHLIRTGEKQMQGLYSEEQTDYIIPPPIENGVIPKNSYGNIDCFVPSMVPQGAVHLPLKGTVRICKKLEIDFAEAVVGFEFGNKMAVPVIHGVVIAKENEKMVRDGWRVWNEEQRKKEETKMEKLVLELWRKMVTGLRIRARVSEEYGVPLEQAGVAEGSTAEQPINVDEDETPLPGGFEPEGDEDFGGGFLVDHEDETRPMEDLVMDHPASQEVAMDANEEVPDASQEYPTPISPSYGQKPVRRARPAILADTESASEDDEVSDKMRDSSPKEDQGGFLMEDDSLQSDSEEVHIPTPKKRGKSVAKSTSMRPTRIQKNGGPQSTRKTPGRAAKTQIPNMLDQSTDEDNSADDSSEGETGELPSRSDNSNPIIQSSRARGRGQPSKKPKTGTRKASRLLRRASAVVTSPYFENGT